MHLRAFIKSAKRQHDLSTRSLPGEAIMRISALSESSSREMGQKESPVCPGETMDRSHHEQDKGK